MKKVGGPRKKTPSKRSCEASTSSYDEIGVKMDKEGTRRRSDARAVRPMTGDRETQKF